MCITRHASITKQLAQLTILLQLHDDFRLVDHAVAVAVGALERIPQPVDVAGAEVSLPVGLLVLRWVLVLVLLRSLLVAFDHLVL